jgi:hypothetical protein
MVSHTNTDAWSHTQTQTQLVHDFDEMVDFVFAIAEITALQQGHG